MMNFASESGPSLRPDVDPAAVRQHLDEAERRLLHYRDNPARFVRECFAWVPGEGPTPYQVEVLEALRTHRRVSVRGPHGLGKTMLAATVVLWFSLTRDASRAGDWKVVMTASAWRQLSAYLAPEVRKWARRLIWEKVKRFPFETGRELLQLSLKLSRGEAFPVASNDPALIEGAHADSILYVLDEAKSIPVATWDAAEGALATGDAYALCISTPGEPQGRFYDIQSRAPGTDDWWVRAVTMEECIAAGRMDPDWAEQRRRQWGEASAVYQNRVLGQFASADSDGVIPLSWVEQAVERHRELEESGNWPAFTRVGCDIGASGEDATVYALRHGNAIRELRSYHKQDLMQTTGQIAGILSQGGEAVIDVIGIGAGVYSRLLEQNLSAIAFNASERTEMKDRSGELGFVSKRAAAWWAMRELLDPANGENIALPPDDLLVGDLTAPHWRVVSGGKIQVESKDDIKKRIGRSTDAGDACCMAYFEEARGVEFADAFRIYSEEDFR